MHLKAITRMLNLPNVIVVDTLECGDAHHHLVVTLSENVGPPVCSHCGAVHTSVHSKGQMRVEDLPSFGRRVFLYLEKRKCRCPDGGIHVEHLPWLHGRFTKRFAEQLSRLTAITTNTEAGWFLGLDDEVVYRIDRTILQEKADDLLVPTPVPKAMSVDEVAWKKGHSYVTNVVDIDKRVVIWNHSKRRLNPRPQDGALLMPPGRGLLSDFRKVVAAERPCKENKPYIAALSSETGR